MYKYKTLSAYFGFHIFTKPCILCHIVKFMDAFLASRLAYRYSVITERVVLKYAIILHCSNKRSIGACHVVLAYYIFVTRQQRFLFYQGSTVKLELERMEWVEGMSGGNEWSGEPFFFWRSWSEVGGIHLGVEMELRGTYSTQDLSSSIE